jgi:major membrane immunogen (membrane-anchored lipoprotein)
MSKLGPRFFVFVFMLLLAFALLRCTNQSSTKVELSGGTVEVQWEEYDGKLWVRTVQRDTTYSFWRPFDLLDNE